jgi:hypothetical protein
MQIGTVVGGQAWKREPRFHPFDIRRGKTMDFQIGQPWICRGRSGSEIERFAIRDNALILISRDSQ